MAAFPRNPEVVTPRYRGPDRRTEGDAEAVLEKRITHDAKGDPVLEVRITSPRRRQDDDTVDQLKCLDADSLSLDDPLVEQSGSREFDPYGRSRKQR